MIRSAPSKSQGRARVLEALPLEAALLAAALISMALLLVFGAPPAAAQEKQTGGDVVAWGDNQYGQSTVPTDLGSVKAVSAGPIHSMALKEDGTVVAWGNNGQGQTDVPTDLGSVKAVSTGLFHNMVLKEDGTVVAWGRSGNGQSTVPTDLANVTAISAGGFHSLAIRDPVPPRVTSVVPVKNATGIRPGTNVSAFFSEAMRADSINTTTFKIFKAGEDRARKATVTYDGATDKATLDPSADLRRGDRYRMVITTWMKDEAGNRLDQDQDPSNGNQNKVWFFTVRN